jgi:predicted DNA-binding transcriptional regulator AlpA
MNALIYNSTQASIESSDCHQTSQAVHGGEVVIGGRVYLTTKRLAAKLGKSPRTIARWTSVGTGPPRIRIGKLILFDVIKVQQWLEAFEAEPVRLPLRRRAR